jgi:hypothetical protein
VCGFCRGVCSPRREERLANRKLIINSGTAALRLDGIHEKTDENAIEIQTPFGLSVVVQRDELFERPSTSENWAGQFPLDREVIEYICQHVNLTDATG